MNSFDIILIVIIGVFCIKGLFRGMIMEVLTLLGLLIGYIVAIKEMSVGAAWLNEIVRLPSFIANTLSFMIIFALVVLLFRLLAGFLRGFLKWSLLGWLDKGGGFFIGLFKGSLIASLLTLLLALIPLSDRLEKERDGSLLFKPIGHVAPAVFNFIKMTVPKSKDFYEEIKEGFTSTSKEVIDDMITKKIDALQKGIDLKSVQDQIKENIKDE